MLNRFSVVFFLVVFTTVFTNTQAFGQSHYRSIPDSLMEGELTQGLLHTEKEKTVERKKTENEYVARFEL